MSENPTRTRTLIRWASLAGLVVATASCGNVVTSSRSPVMLVVNSLLASPGTTSGALGTLGSPLASSVINFTTLPVPCTPAGPTSPSVAVVSDVGSAAFSVVMKDAVDATVTPTTNNEVTITQYHVAYQRADGQNTPGVGVPYPLDGAVALTIAANATGTLTFEIVTAVAKQESPLVQLMTNTGVITTIANVTFYGHDTVGNAVSVTGSIVVDFGNFSCGGG